MKVKLNNNVVGRRIQDGELKERTYAKSGDILFVILANKTHYICEAPYSKIPVIVFNNQISEIIHETERSSKDEDVELEKYYNVYEQKTELKNDFLYNADEDEY